jgi:hypothetical protein
MGSENLGWCVDTVTPSAAGYELGTKFEIRKFETICGFKIAVLTSRSEQVCMTGAFRVTRSSG